MSQVFGGNNQVSLKQSISMKNKTYVKVFHKKNLYILVESLLRIDKRFLFLHDLPRDESNFKNTKHYLLYITW